MELVGCDGTDRVEERRSPDARDDGQVQAGLALLEIRHVVSPKAVARGGRRRPLACYPRPMLPRRRPSISDALQCRVAPTPSPGSYDPWSNRIIVTHRSCADELSGGAVGDG